MIIYLVQDTCSFKFHFANILWNECALLADSQYTSTYFGYYKQTCFSEHAQSYTFRCLKRKINC